MHPRGAVDLAIKSGQRDDHEEGLRERWNRGSLTFASVAQSVYVKHNGDHWFRS